MILIDKPRDSWLNIKSNLEPFGQIITLSASFSFIVSWILFYSYKRGVGIYYHDIDVGFYNFIIAIIFKVFFYFIVLFSMLLVPYVLILYRANGAYNGGLDPIFFRDRIYVAARFFFRYFILSYVYSVSFCFLLMVFSFNYFNGVNKLLLLSITILIPLILCAILFYFLFINNNKIHNKEIISNLIAFSLLSSFANVLFILSAIEFLHGMFVFSIYEYDKISRGTVELIFYFSRIFAIMFVIIFISQCLLLSRKILMFLFFLFFLVCALGSFSGVFTKWLTSEHIGGGIPVQVLLRARTEVDVCIDVSSATRDTDLCLVPGYLLLRTSSGVTLISEPRLINNRCLNEVDIPTTDELFQRRSAQRYYRTTDIADFRYIPVTQKEICEAP